MIGLSLLLTCFQDNMAEFQGEVASLSFLRLKELSALGLGLLTAHAWSSLQYNDPCHTDEPPHPQTLGLATPFLTLISISFLPTVSPLNYTLRS